MNIVIHKSLWRIMASIVFLLMMLSNNAYAELPKSAQADKFKLLISESLKSENYKDALRYIGKLEALKVKIPDSIMYYKGESYFHVSKWNEATEQLEKYITKTGSSGKYYKEALVVLGKLEREYSWSSYDKTFFVTPLIKASKEGRLSLVNYLLDKGTYSINAKHIIGKTALMFACHEGHYEIAKELIARGAELNGQMKWGSSALSYAVRNNDLKMLKLLIDSGANVNLQRHTNGLTELMATGNIELMKVLISSGAKLDIIDNVGDTALHIKVRPRVIKGPTYIVIGYEAFNDNDFMKVKLLVEKGATLNIKNNEGQTPLDIAIKEKNNKAIALLKKHGAKTGAELKESTKE